ncbi:hypothetical protein KC345_g3369 [Hortaea werneckii]|nr:hypothetical protein KC345_g3369 [Hortaea werneckii]
MTAAGVLSSSANSSYAADSAAGTAGYTTEQLDALTFLNEVRGKSGVPPVSLSAPLNQAADAHAKYYNTNKDQHPGLSAHSEIAGNPGFTGSGVTARVKAAGWVSGSRGYALGEVMTFQHATGREAIQSWLDTAYHREIILGAGYSELGFALVQGTGVADLAGPGSISPITGGISVYPYDGQTGVPVGFYGLEIPNPLDQFGAEYSGYIISAAADKPIVSHQATITDESGKAITYHEELDGKYTLFLYPKSVLEGYHKYTVSLQYQVEGSPETLSKIWSFTTGKGHGLTRIIPELNELVMNENGKLQIQLNGQYDDGVTEPLADGVTFASSNPNSLRVSLSGELTAVKAGDYTVKIAKGGVSVTVKVKVHAKWKTKAYTGTSPALIHDISGHKNQAAIEWGLQTGIIAPAAKGIFKPDGSISEAEFWSLLLKAYNVNISAYQPAKVKHWADAAYLIAKERNYPLKGLTATAERDKPLSRLKAAEIVSAADGINVRNSDAITYVLAKDYIRGITALSYEGYQGETLLTRAEAVQLVQNLRPKLSELRGAPVSATPASSLPELPPQQVYIRPVLEDRSLLVTFREDHSLVFEGKFTAYAGQTVDLMIQAKTEAGSKALEAVKATLDSQGQFRVEAAGPFQWDALNLYFNPTPSLGYYISVHYNTMNYSHYSQ